MYQDSPGRSLTVCCSPWFNDFSVASRSSCPTARNTGSALRQRLRPEAKVFVYNSCVEHSGCGAIDNSLALSPSLSSCTHPLRQSNFSRTVPHFDFTITLKTVNKIVTLDSDVWEATSCPSSIPNTFIVTHALGGFKYCAKWLNTPSSQGEQKVLPSSSTELIGFFS